MSSAPKNLPADRAKQGRGIDRLTEILKNLYQTGKPQRPNDIATGIGAPKSMIAAPSHEGVLPGNA